MNYEVLRHSKFLVRYSIFNTPPSPKLRRTKGAVAQLVEQRTENPCVGGSIPPHTTNPAIPAGFVFLFMILMSRRRNMNPFSDLFNHFFIKSFQVFRAPACYKT